MRDSALDTGGDGGGVLGVYSGVAAGRPQLVWLLWYGWWRRRAGDVRDSASDTGGDGGGVLGVYSGVAGV